MPAIPQNMTSPIYITCLMIMYDAASWNEGKLEPDFEYLFPCAMLLALHTTRDFHRPTVLAATIACAVNMSCECRKPFVANNLSE